MKNQNADTRTTALQDKIWEHMQATEHCSNYAAMRAEKELSDWCKLHGYTQIEFNRAKTVVVTSR